MEDDNFFIHKESFIQSRRENISDYYTILNKEIGKGAFGVVYKAKAKAGGEWRAVKKMNKSLVKQPQLLINEIQILKSIDHPSCIKLYETFQDQKYLYLVTDLCEGGELFQRIDNQGNFSEEDARKIFIQIIEAVAYCHQHKIAHRDFKPENFLFLDPFTLNVKLIDFGLALRWKYNMKNELAVKGDKRLVGTSYYMAPEIIKGSYDERCDIWSAGVILYVLLTAQPPFNGDDDKEIIGNVKKLNYTMNIPELDQASKEVKNLIEKILRPELERLSTAEIFNHPWVQKQQSKSPIKVQFAKFQNFNNFSKIKKLAATFIATQLSEKEVEELGHLFKQIDLNHKGYLSAQEMRIVLREENNLPSIKELTAIIDSIDTNKNGKIHYNEFLASQMDQKKLFTEIKIKHFFDLVDKNGDGSVSRKQITSLLKSFGTEFPNEKTIDEIMQTCDKDGNGVIDWQKFKMSILN